MRVRADFGELGSKPDEHWNDQMITNGQVLILARQLETRQLEVRAIDAATCRPVWARPAGYWTDHALVAGYYAYWAKDRFEVLDPSTGQPICGYPF
jgi:hypothetical protein